MKFDKLETDDNASRRLPIVFCLDVSPSMGWKKNRKYSSIELLNRSMNKFAREIKEDPSCRAAAEIAFVTFSTDIEIDSPFIAARDLKEQKFSPVKEGGTNLSGGIIASIKKIEKRAEELMDSETPFYAPFLVIITDGDPDDSDEESSASIAKQMILDHCSSKKGARDIIIPFIIGIGDLLTDNAINRLNDYSKGFSKGFYHIKGDDDENLKGFDVVLRLIRGSVGTSVSLSKYFGDTEYVETIIQNMNEVIDELLDKEENHSTSDMNSYLNSIKNDKV